MIYLATPYSHDDPNVRAARFDQACIIAGTLMNSGHLVFSPIAHSHPIALKCELPTTWDYWRRYDYRMLLCSTKLVVAMMDGWQESKGVQAEITIAKEFDIPIEYLNYDLK